MSDHRVILVTGGTGGLGGTIVETLAAEGATVAFTFAAGEVRARELEARTEGALAFPLDLADPAAPAELVRRVEAELGPVEGLVNNAGVRADGLLAFTSDEAWQRVVDVNLGGVFRCCRAVVPGMVGRRRGAIVNVSSLSARLGLAGQASYAASKAGVLGLTRALAREVGSRGIRVNAVAPGFVATEMTEELPEEVVRSLRSRECLPDGVSAASVAATVAFLLSERASGITGQCLFVDAGVSA
ncbi:MAG: SDR family oxidoreductase [Thermoanaerobaculia bacterium]